mgnify:FL=1
MELPFFLLNIASKTTAEASFFETGKAYSSDLHLLNTKIQLLSNRTQKVWIIASSWQDKT